MVPSHRSPRPSLAPFRAPLAPRAREPRAPASAALSSLSSGLAGRSRPSEKLAPHPAQIALFRPGPPLAGPGAGAQLLWHARTPSLRAEGPGRRRTVPFQGPQRPSWAAPESGDPSQRGRPCARSLGPGFHRQARGTGLAARRRQAASRGRREVVTLLGRVRGAGRRAPGEGPSR